MKKAIISRTIINYRAVGKCFNEATNSVESFGWFVPAAVNTTERAEKFLRKNNLPVGKKIILVNEVQKTEMLIGMYVDEFMEKATKVSERSKETRDCITKTVTVLAGTALYMNEKEEVKKAPVVVPTNCPNIDAYIRKNYKFDGAFIMAKDMHEVSELYSMSENDFIKNARPMKNKFTLD